MPETHPLVAAARAVLFPLTKEDVPVAAVRLNASLAALPTRTAAEAAVATLIRAALTGDTTAAETKLLQLIPTRSDQ